MSQPPPGSMGVPYLGKALTILKDPFTFTIEGTRRHGNVWRTRILGDTVVIFAGAKAYSFFMDPANFTRENGTPGFFQDLLHRDAVPFLDGDRHRARKRLLLSAFKPDALASYLPGIFTIFERFVARWGDEQPVVEDLFQLGFDVADYLFAAADPAASNTEVAADFMTFNRGSFATPIKLPFTAYGKAIKARDRLRAYLKQRVAERDGANTALGVLKSARGPDGEQLASEELEIELLHFFYAAHAALTAALAWMLVALGEHPDMAARLRAEADAALGDGVPSYDQIQKLVQARVVAREVLRAYPIVPVTFLGIAKKDLELDGLHIRAGWKGAGAIWATLQDGAQFRDPTAFRADRLDDDAFAALPPNSYVPQGGGDPHGHRCAGEALIQLLLPGFLGWFTRRYDLVFPEQDARPGGGGIGPMPRSGLRIAVKPRG